MHLHALSRSLDKPSPQLFHLGLHDHAPRAAEFASGFRRAKSFGKSRIVASLGDSKPSSSGGLFWQPFWNRGANSGASSSLGISGGGDSGAGDGGGGGGGGDGNGGDGGGGFDGGGFGGGEIHVNAVVKEIGDEEQQALAKSPDFRAPGLASLSSAAGDALDGEAPFGDLLLGRNNKRAVEEKQGMAGGILRKLDKAAQNYLSPNNANHREPSGKNSHLKKKSYVCNWCLI